MEFMGCLGVENKFDSKQECDLKCISNNVALNKRGMDTFYQEVYTTQT